MIGLIRRDPESLREEAPLPAPQVRRRHAWRLTLGRKLALVTAAFVLLWSGHVGVGYLGRQQAVSFSALVSESGKLRMHSQRIAFLAALCDRKVPQQDAESELCRTAIRQAIHNYDTSLRVVGSAPLRFFRSEDRRLIAAAIESLQADWSGYRAAAKAVVTPGGENDGIDPRLYIEGRTELLLDRAEALTDLLVTSQHRAQEARDRLQNVLQLLGLLLLVAIAGIGYRQGVLPLRELARLARRAERGDYGWRLDYRSADEVGELVDAFNEGNVRTQRLLNELAAEAAAAWRAEVESGCLLESAADGIVISDRNGRILRINREAERIFGYPRQELVGRSVQELVPIRFRQAHCGYHAGYVHAPASRSMGQTTAVPGLRKDGSEVSVEISLSPAQFDEQFQVIAVVRDVTQRLRAEADRRRLLTILDATPDLIAIFTLDCELVYLNPAGRRLLGMAADDPLEGRRLDELLEPEAYQVLREEALPVVLAAGVWNGELVLRDRTGAEIPVSQLVISHTGDSQPPRYLSTIARDISERKRHEVELTHRATHDQLTGLANRTLFEDKLEQAIHHAQCSGSMVAVVFIDLDNFKLVNDTMGHAAGDALLSEIAQRLQTHLRKHDTKARLGGDEFAVILERLFGPEDVIRIVHDLGEALRHPISLRGREFAVTTSIGISLYPNDGTTVEALLMHADTAMYEAKAAGRNSHRFYRPSMNLRVAERLDMESDLRQALARDELRLHYQPVVSATDAAIVGCEALLRWQHPVHGLLASGRFIPVAEESGLIVPIGRWVLEQACRQAQAWKATGLALNYVAVNISARQLREPALTEIVGTALADSGLPAEALELELTEGSVLPGAAVACQILSEIQSLGVRLVADDFGTGYSSLSALKLFRFDKVKIDRQFVCDLLTDPGDAAIVKATIAMAHAFGAVAVAEGVETEAQADILRHYGCDQLQGYLFGLPVDAAEFQLLLQMRTP